MSASACDGDAQRMGERHDVGRRADADLLGARRDVRGEQHRLGRDAVAVEVVLGHPDRVEAQGLRLDHEVGFLPVDLGVGDPLRGLHEMEYGEFHRGSS